MYSAGRRCSQADVRIARELVLDGGFQTSGAVVLDHAEIEAWWS